MSKKLSLLQQFEIEAQRRKLKDINAEFDPKKNYDVQLKKILPNIIWKPLQKAFINAKQFIKWYLGGYKSGKTFTGVAKDIWLSFINRPYAGVLVHPTADGIQLTILPTIEEICKLNSIEFEIKKLATTWKVFFKFGLHKKDWGCLIIVSGERPQSKKGPKYAWGHIDEPLILKKEINDVIISRIAEVKGKLQCLLYTGTPEPEHMQWGFDIVDKKFEDTPARYITTVSTREVKEYLPDNYIENYEANSTPEQIATFIDGEYRNLSQGKVYQNFDRKKNVYDIKLPFPVSLGDFPHEFVITYDFNVSQMSACLLELIGRMKIQQEEYRIQSRSDTRELTRLIIQRLKDEDYLKMVAPGKFMTKYARSFIVSGDASGMSEKSSSNKSDYQQIIEEFEKEGIQISLALNYTVDKQGEIHYSNPAVRDRVNYINTEFELGYFLISNKCPLSIRDRELTSWKLGADGFSIDKSKKELTHLAEAGDYGCWNTRVITTGDISGTNSRVKTYYREKRW